MRHIFVFLALLPSSFAQAKSLSIGQCYGFGGGDVVIEWQILGKHPKGYYVRTWQGQGYGQKWVLYDCKYKEDAKKLNSLCVDFKKEPLDKMLCSSN